MRAKVQTLALLIGLTSLPACALLGGNDVTKQVGARPSLNLYLSMQSENAVRVVSVTDRRFLTSFPVGLAPANLAVNPRADREYLYSANSGDGTVSFVNLRSRVVEQAIQTGSGPWGIDVSVPSKVTGSTTVQYVFVTNRGDRTVSRIDVEKRSVKTVSLPAVYASYVPTGIVANPAAGSNEAYVFANSASGSIVCRMSSDGSIIDQKEIPQSRELWRGAIAGNFLYVADRQSSFLHKIQISPAFQVENAIQLNTVGASDVVVDSGARTAFVAVPTGQSNGTPDNGQVIVIDLASGQAQPFSVNRDVTDASRPESLAINSLNTELWVGLSNKLGLYSSITPGQGTVLKDGLQAISYAPAGGQAPPIADLVCGPGIQ